MNSTESAINRQIVEYKGLGLLDTNNISDTYHTFGELYEFRKMYNAALFNEWALEKPFTTTSNVNDYQVKIEYNPALHDFIPKYNVHKSWKHYDGELCFGGGWFIVNAMLPTGLISNHYEEKDWDLFKVPIVEKALFEYDGYKGSDVLERLKNL